MCYFSDMPEENNSIDLQRTLDILEDPTLNKPLLKGQYLNVFLTALNNHTKMSTLIVNRLLAVCVHALEEDKVAIIHVMKIIQSLLKRIEVTFKVSVFKMMSSRHYTCHYFFSLYAT